MQADPRRVGECARTGSGWRLECTYASLPRRLHERVRPARFSDPRVRIVNGALAAELGLDLSSMDAGELAHVLSGQSLPEGADPIAQAYAGHQFGGFAVLGDGRAILIGEQRTPDGRLLDVQLKGAGPTPYSRGGDGLAALGPMLREHIVSEAMHALGIPTTRSLAVLSTGDPVMRDRVRRGAVLVRVASSHIRVGTFQFVSATGDADCLRALADYAIARHDPSLVGLPGRHAQWLDAVVARQAALVARWQLVGFVHGVMNTDNMTISGETIDYGPCAFMDAYHRGTVFSSIDRHGRYAYASQPGMALWNLARFAEAILPLLHDSQDEAVEIATASVHRFPGIFESQWLDGMRRKLGIEGSDPSDAALIGDLLSWMERAECDFTATFSDLSKPELPGDGRYGSEEFARWHARWMRRLGSRGTAGTTSPLAAQGHELPESARRIMVRANPAVIPRNHLVEEALGAAENDGDLAPVQALVDAVTRPFDAAAPRGRCAEPPPPSWRGYRTFCGT